MTEQLPRVITRRELRRLVPYTPQHILRLEKKGSADQVGDAGWDGGHEAGRSRH